MVLCNISEFRKDFEASNSVAGKWTTKWHSERMILLFIIVSDRISLKRATFDNKIIGQMVEEFKEQFDKNFS